MNMFSRFRLRISTLHAAQNYRCLLVTSSNQCCLCAVESFQNIARSVFQNFDDQRIYAR